ncbi:MAG: hypothetical protein C5B52_04380 [Bacteroidetes bacterium]|nr:MAG: hypothetical protein C5B52_04380 [Bacteroidota bacterium]
MRRYLISLLMVSICLQLNAQTNKIQSPARAQSNKMLDAANQFLATLNATQKSKVIYALQDTERYNWHFIPKDDRKGISLNELNADQKKAAMNLLQTGVSEQCYDKVIGITQLENVLKVLENHPPEDHFRDPGKYFFTVFGEPSANSIWGWRLEGHHISFNFVSEKNQIVSGTPGFLGSNPWIVQSGPDKGKEVLKDEADLGFQLLNSLKPDQLSKTIIDSVAPHDIVTYVNRKAIIENPRGIKYSELDNRQKQIMMNLLALYIHRYTKLFADDMMNEIQAAGLDNLRFAWAGAKENAIGNPHYYRITGPTIVIEYDNTQNNGNHVHTVVRDLKRDFGGDELLEHYKKDHNTSN